MFLFTFLNNLFIIFCFLTIITNIPIIFKSLIYDYFLTDYTKKHYEYFFKHIQSKIKDDNIYSDENIKIKILDIGIGTGTALNKYLTENKNDFELNKLLNRIEYFGIDIDDKYLENCKNILEKNTNLNFDLFNINLMNESNRQSNNKIIGIYTNKEYKNIGKYDFIFFSDSFSVIPTINNYSIYNLLKYLQNLLLNPKGSICIGTTINYNYNKIRAYIKKNIVKIFGIDFGEYITFNDYISNLNKNKIIIKNDFVQLDNNGKEILNCSNYLLESDKKFSKNYINQKCKYITDNYNGINIIKNIFDKNLFLYGNTHSFFTELTQLN